MSDADSRSPDASAAGSKAASSAAAAAAERSRSTQRRLLELQQRLERLRAGQASTREDVTRARLAAEAQRRAYIQAQRRLASARGGSTRHSDEATGPDDRQASSMEARERYSRLREAFVSLASSHPVDSETRSDEARRRQLTAALVEEASTTTRRWTEALCQLGVAVVAGASGSAISTYDQLGVAHPIAACDDRSLEIEQLQQVVGEGPGYAARVSAEPVVVDDLTREDRRWPGYVGVVRGHGIGVVWSFPVAIEGSVLASLTFYHDRGTVPDYLVWGDAEMLAGLAAAAMVIDADLAAQRGPTPSHPPNAVDLASGVLAVRAGVRVDQALALLRGHSFSTGRRISEVAADVLTGAVDLG